MHRVLAKKTIADWEINRLISAIEQGKYGVNDSRYLLEEMLRLSENRRLSAGKLRALLRAWTIMLESRSKNLDYPV